MQEGARARGDEDVLAVAGHFEFVERAQRRFSLALGRAEGREIVAADEMPGRFVHRRRVERHHDLPCPVAIQRQPRAPVDDAIEIMPGLRGEAGVEDFVHDLAGDDRDGCRPQMEVQRVAHRSRRVLPLQVEMRNLPARCTPASVRPAPRGTTCTPLSASMARASSPCTEGPFAWICQPA